MDRFTSMRIFCRVAERSSFTAVAEETNLSTTMVSKHVAQLEKSIGVTLLNRTTRKVSLTEIGREYYQRSKRLLDDLMDLDDSMSQLGGMPSGTLRVMAPIDFGGMHMVRAIDAYQRACPNVVVQLLLDNRDVDLGDGLYDVAIRVTDVLSPGLVASYERKSRLDSLTH